jgi:hypothetical protein
MTTILSRADIGWWLRHGAIGGFVAGIPFALFEMAAAAMMMGAEATTMPLRMIGAIALGADALEPSFPLLTAAGAGIVLHMALSTVYGLAFGVAVGALPVLRSPGLLIAAGVAYGLALWVVNFFLIAPVAGWKWFPNQTDPIVQIVAHGLIFGAVLGGYLTFARRRVEARRGAGA